MYYTSIIATREDYTSFVGRKSKKETTRFADPSSSSIGDNDNNMCLVPTKYPLDVTIMLFAEIQTELPSHVRHVTYSCRAPKLRRSG